MSVMHSCTIRRIDPVSHHQPPHTAVLVLPNDTDAHAHPIADVSIRIELVSRIQAEIAAGIYESEEKLAIACERLLDRLGS